LEDNYLNYFALPEAHSDRPPPDGAALRRSCDRAANFIARTETERGIARTETERGIALRSLEAQYHQLHGLFLKHMQTESDERRFNRLINNLFLLIEDIKACIS